jgi:hypothetical protein
MYVIIHPSTPDYPAMKIKKAREGKSINLVHASPPDSRAGGRDGNKNQDKYRPFPPFVRTPLDPGQEVFSTSLTSAPLFSSLPIPSNSGIAIEPSP